MGLLEAHLRHPTNRHTGWCPFPASSPAERTGTPVYFCQFGGVSKMVEERALVSGDYPTAVIVSVGPKS